MTKEGLSRRLVQSGLLGVEVVQRAVELTDQSMAGQLRLSGEPAAEHQYEVAHLLYEIGQPSSVIAAGAMHDLPEDARVSIFQIVRQFGNEIAFLVDGLNFDEEFSELEESEKTFWYYVKLYWFAQRDPRVILIKLADRLHYVRTKSHMTEESRRMHAQETLDVLLPMADAVCRRMYGGLEPVRPWIEELQRLSSEDYQESNHPMVSFFTRAELRTITPIRYSYQGVG
ncbi:HD domain-containing protein [Patescibacteria group bacterium]|nr:HD domain-containing protein [Patescibacteria group bacterium]MBU1890484.1 HD domain-containing protein [Patescibacteria group bacterium]